MIVWVVKTCDEDNFSTGVLGQWSIDSVSVSVHASKRSACDAVLALFDISKSFDIWIDENEEEVDTLESALEDFVRSRRAWTQLTARGTAVIVLIEGIEL